ncbi:unknown [Corallococcus sp. CAG:1435]|nr:unknown [Corallococcus sp. CAG:1435]
MWQTIQKHIAMLLQYMPERVVNNEMKKHVAFYLKGMRNAKQTVIAVAQSASLAFTEEAVNKFFIENSSYRTVTDD